jgi:hypothetical protein
MEAGAPPRAGASMGPSRDGIVDIEALLSAAGAGVKAAARGDFGGPALANGLGEHEPRGIGRRDQ